ncbi:MAG: hypothetical protein DDT30_02119 [Dehalococcoidia bacterium]|nr:hypothetical protein [Bacillota bacterium]MBT9144155.1 hypothetical protein [Bacillota bacterium]MBT9166675.1 hypothetical protein [Chloroflexota bacterium]
MGHVFVNAYLEGTMSGEEIRMLVDTGATFTAIPEELAERLGIPRLKPRRTKLADSREVDVEVGVVDSIRINGREIPTLVLIMGDEPLLGVETLETLGLKVNPETGELEPTRSFVLRV